jgi:hypothetical protein
MARIIPDQGRSSCTLASRRQCCRGPRWPASYLIKDVVPALWRVAGNVAEGPDGLLLDVLLLGEQQAHEDGDGARLDDAARLLARPGGDVGERPGSLELL